jgi:Cu/Ag efflux pump CusA
MKQDSRVGQFATRHSLAIAFISLALCLAGIYAAFKIPSSVFPQTNFPRVVILVDNGVMPADEMMATITRPIEETMKDIPGVREQPAVANPLSAAGDRQHDGLAADIFSFPHYRGESHQPAAQHH